MSQRPGPADDPDGPVLDRSEEAALERSVQSVARRGRGPAVAVVLIALAFVVGLVRPWDWIPSGDPGLGDGGAGASSTAAPERTGAAASEGPAGASPEGSGTLPAGEAAHNCGYPQSWRSATIQHWAGRPARVWSAVDAAAASGPGDPAVPFRVIAGEDFTALGWCAPVEGDDRPPMTARGSLFRVDGGTAVEVPYDRLEPTDPDALGELWRPEAGPDGTHPDWPPGRYVIRLATPTGAYVRYLGLEIEPPRDGATAPPGPAGSASPAGGASPTTEP